MDEQFMQRALEIARESLDITGALPYGAVVVKDGQIVGEGLNKARTHNDPTSHGEIEAIRDACVRLGTTDLTGCALYSTAEPCSMCVAAMQIVGIGQLYYASASAQSATFVARIAAVDPSWRRRMSNDELRHQVGLTVDQRAMPSEQLLADEAIQLFDAFARRHGA